MEKYQKQIESKKKKKKKLGCFSIESMGRWTKAVLCKRGTPSGYNFFWVLKHYSLPPPINKILSYQQSKGSKFPQKERENLYTQKLMRLALHVNSNHSYSQISSPCHASTTTHISLWNFKGVFKNAIYSSSPTRGKSPQPWLYHRLCGSLTQLYVLVRALAHVYYKSN